MEIDKYKSIAERIFKVLGTSHNEVIYHKAFELELQKLGIIYETEKVVTVKYPINNTYMTVGYEKLDIFIPSESTIIELKAMKNSPRELEIGQVHKYYRELLKDGVNIKYGVIINFPQSGTKLAKNDIDFIPITF